MSEKLTVTEMPKRQINFLEIWGGWRAGDGLFVADTHQLHTFNDAKHFLMCGVFTKIAPVLIVEWGDHKRTRIIPSPVFFKIKDGEVRQFLRKITDLESVCMNLIGDMPTKFGKVIYSWGTIMELLDAGEEDDIHEDHPVAGWFKYKYSLALNDPKTLVEAQP